jgi:hypothetical protein
MLSGSFASAHCGVPRSTQDIDLVIEATPAELRAFVEALSDKECGSEVGALGVAGGQVTGQYLGL